MKPIKLVIPLLFIVISLTACVGQRKLDANEFLNKYNLLSGEALNKEELEIAEGEYFTYRLLHGENLLCLYSNEDGEIFRCTVTAKSKSEDFDTFCINIIRSFTDLNANESRDFLQNGGTEGKYNLFVNDYGIGKTMILNKKSDPLNSNGNPTLKRYVDEKNIARPTLSDTTTTIKH